MTIPVAANAWPSGPVEDAAFEHIAGRICAAVAAGCDAVLLDLHGAMVTRSHEDGEGELLRRIRAIAPTMPIGVALDMHTNLFPAMVGRCHRHRRLPDLSARRHVRDRPARRARRARAARRARRGRRMAWGQRPMLPHVMRQGSDDSPNRELQARCREMEAQGALSASLFVGFPHADIPNAGLSAVVVTDGDAALARRWCDELLDMAWQARADVRLPTSSRWRIRSPGAGDRGRETGRQRPGRAARPLRQLRLGRHDGHDDGARRDPRRRARGRRGVRDLRPGRGAADGRPPASARRSR